MAGILPVENYQYIFHREELCAFTSLVGPKGINLVQRKLDSEKFIYQLKEFMTTNVLILTNFDINMGTESIKDLCKKLKGVKEIMSSTVSFGFFASLINHLNKALSDTHGRRFSQLRSDIHEEELDGKTFFMDILPYVPHVFCLVFIILASEESSKYMPLAQEMMHSWILEGFSVLTRILFHQQDDIKKSHEKFFDMMAKMILIEKRHGLVHYLISVS